MFSIADLNTDGRLNLIRAFQGILFLLSGKLAFLQIENSKQHLSESVVHIGEVDCPLEAESAALHDGRMLNSGRG